MLTTLLQSVLELDKTLAGLAVAYGPWLYALLFAVIFAETGLVVFPFLPGDSLLFIAGTPSSLRAAPPSFAGRYGDHRLTSDHGSHSWVPTEESLAFGADFLCWSTSRVNSGLHRLTPRRMGFDSPSATRCRISRSAKRTSVDVSSTTEHDRLIHFQLPVRLRVI